ncbi:hypothetical protein AGDE_00861 [Angomonas deanei]|uniref:Nodulin-like, putative n=1 Tax=Angomonas deanei TaxID=59799 RepID=A0A7G2CWA4_9TRYP|nr:hypothetical protein AGDE_00861 [Angomonas deanei]CAD2222713.1 Nodulin-like, putative [Angomonas deanei]|eukprot:EPY43062.1 hypothetical protein AGDE_00861 [Angomonas deanei]
MTTLQDEPAMPEHNPSLDENGDVDHVKVDVLPSQHTRRINEYHRFALVVIGGLACVCTSFGAAWNVISGYMQELLNLSQTDLVNINLVGSVFTYFALPYAFLYDYAGPIPVSIISIVMFVLGSLLFSLAFGGQIRGSVVRLCVFNAIMKTGCILFDLVGNITVVSHFPTMRGPTIALLKSFVGIGGAVVSAVQLGFFPELDDIKNFYYLLMVYATVMGLLELAFMRNPRYHLSGYEESYLTEEEKECRRATKAQYLRQEPPVWRFAIGYGVILLLVVYLPTQSACVQYMGLGDMHKRTFAVITVFFLLLITLVLIPNPVRIFRKRRGDHVRRMTPASPLL